LESGTGYPFSSFPSESCINLFLGREWFPYLFHLPITPLIAVSVPGLCVIYYYLTYNSKSNKTRKKKKREPKKSTGRGVDKQTDLKKKIPCSVTIEFQSY
jgi:hypothetical protein